MKKLISLIFIISTLFAYDIFKEIKINNANKVLINKLIKLNIDLDHVHLESDNSIQFVISETDLMRVRDQNINYNIIHEDVEFSFSFYCPCPLLPIELLF